jgi:hypothetical protein
MLLRAAGVMLCLFRRRRAGIALMRLDYLVLEAQRREAARQFTG